MPPKKIKIDLIDPEREWGTKPSRGRPVKNATWNEKDDCWIKLGTDGKVEQVVPTKGHGYKPTQKRKAAQEPSEQPVPKVGKKAVKHGTSDSGTNPTTAVIEGVQALNHAATLLECMQKEINKATESLKHAVEAFKEACKTNSTKPAEKEEAEAEEDGKEEAEDGKEEDKEKDGEENEEAGEEDEEAGEDEGEEGE